MSMIEFTTEIERGEGNDYHTIVLTIRGRVSSYHYNGFNEPPDEPEIDIECALDADGIDWLDSLTSEELHAIEEELTERADDERDMRDVP